MDGPLLISCVLALSVAGGILVMLYAPIRDSLVPSMPRAPLGYAVEMWRPAPAPVPAPFAMAPVAVAPAQMPAMVAPPQAVMAPVLAPPPIPPPSMPVARPAPAFVPVVRSHGALPPLSRTRAARGTEPPRESKTASPPPMLADFVTEDATAIDDESTIDGPTVVRF